MNMQNISYTSSSKSIRHSKLNVYDSSSIIVNLVGGSSYGDKEYVVEVHMEGLKNQRKV